MNQLHLKKGVTKLLQWRPGKWLLNAAVLLFAPTHRIGVNTIVLNPQRQVLLLNHVFHPTCPWGPPGGWLDRGEDPQVGALRELREETGLEATLGQLVFMRRSTQPDQLGMAFVVHLPNTPDPQTFKLSYEISAAAWFDPQQLPPYVTRFTQEALTAALKHPHPTL